MPLPTPMEILQGALRKLQAVEQRLAIVEAKLAGAELEIAVLQQKLAENGDSGGQAFGIPT